MALRGGPESASRLLTVAPRFWIAAAVTGVAGFAVSFLLFNSAIARVDAGCAAVVLNLIPVLAVASAVTFLGEGVTGREAIGALLVGTSVLYFTVAERREAAGRRSVAMDSRCAGIHTVADSHGALPRSHGWISSRPRHLRRCRAARSVTRASRR
jgi:EamA-like transporter family